MSSSQETHSQHPGRGAGRADRPVAGRAPADSDGELLRFLSRLSRFGLAAGMEPLLKPLKPAS